MIFVDRSVPRSIAEALQKVRSDVRWLEDVWMFRHYTPETHWLPIVGLADWLVVSRDKKIRTRPAERQALMDARVGAFLFTQKSDPTKWEYLKLLAKDLDDMEVIFDTTAHPFIYGIQRSGVLQRIL